MATQAIPKRVVLCGIGYNVVVADNMVLFSTEPGVAGCFTRLMFERACGCWHVSITASADRVMVSHVIEANKLVEGWFGVNFDCPRGENRL